VFPANQRLSQRFVLFPKLNELVLDGVIFPVITKLVRFPTLVILGCAAVVTVPAVVAVAAARLATTVVDVTTRGAVPVVTLEIS